MHGWLKIKSAAKYADISERTLRHWLKQGLRHVKKEGTIYVKPEWIDLFLLKYEDSLVDLDAVADEVLAEF